MNIPSLPQKKVSAANSISVRFKKLGASVIAYSLKRGTRTTLIAMSVIALALGYVGYGYIVSPNIAENAAALTTVQKQEADNALNAQVEQTEAAFKVEFRKAVELYRTAQPLLPSSVEVGNVLAQVQMAAGRNGVTLTGLNALKEGVKSPASDKLYERELPALVTGTHPQVKRFFEDVSRLPRIALIRDFDEVSLRQRVSVSFTLIAYNSPPPAEIPALPKEFGPLLSDVIHPAFSQASP